MQTAQSIQRALRSLATCRSSAGFLLYGRTRDGGGPLNDIEYWPDRSLFVVEVLAESPSGAAPPRPVALPNGSGHGVRPLGGETVVANEHTTASVSDLWRDVSLSHVV